MRVLVCGGRNYNDYDRVREILQQLPITTIIQGGARGADLLANHYASEFNIPVSEFRADWARLGKSAGFVRNKQMLVEGNPDLVVAFPGGRGTENMVQLAKEAGVEVIEVASSN